MLVAQKEQSPSERICNNLINAGYLSSPNECVITDYTPGYMETYFPIGNVDVAYVRAGMQGFELAKEYHSTECLFGGLTCESLDYVIETRFFLIGDETYQFGFTDSILTDTQWHD
jgi:hypothetical protein